MTETTKEELSEFAKEMIMIMTLGNEALRLLCEDKKLNDSYKQSCRHFAKLIRDGEKEFLDAGYSQDVARDLSLNMVSRTTKQEK